MEVSLRSTCALVQTTKHFIFHLPIKLIFFCVAKVLCKYKRSFCFEINASSAQLGRRETYTQHRYPAPRQSTTQQYFYDTCTRSTIPGTGFHSFQFW